MRLTARLKDEIMLKQKARYNPNEPQLKLPENIYEFLGNVVDIPSEHIDSC
jgi:hypothetical protein